MRLLLFTLAGCNAVFGNHSVGVETQSFDAPADSAPACSPTAPAFRSNIYQVATEKLCSHYSVSETGIAMAICTQNSTPMLAIGPRNADMTFITTDIDPKWNFHTVHISPEGDFALVQLGDVTDGSQIHALAPVAGDMMHWTDLGSTAIFSNGASPFGGPTRGPDRHVIVFDNGGKQFEEYTGDQVSWIGTGSPSSLQLVLDDDIALTADGLSFVAKVHRPADSDYSISYSHRAAISDPFGDAFALDQSIEEANLAMSEDCGALYFTALDRTLYLEQ